MTGSEKATAFLKEQGYEDRILMFDISTATVSLAATAIGCEEAHIAKSLTFYGQEGHAILILAAGDAKVDNRKFKEKFGFKANMLKGEDIFLHTGYQIGGVCPFDLPNTTEVFFDESLYRFDTVYPACGDSATVARFHLSELEKLLKTPQRVNVCKNWQVEE